MNQHASQNTENRRKKAEGDRKLSPNRRGATLGPSKKPTVNAHTANIRMTEQMKS